MTVYDATSPVVQEHKLRAQLGSVAHRAKLATQLIRHKRLSELNDIFGPGHIVVDNEGVMQAGNRVPDVRLAALLPLLQGDEAAPPHPDPVGRAKFLLRTQGKFELEAAIRAKFNVRWCEIKQDGNVQILENGRYRYLSEEELVAVI
jgi:hypothetical protein